MVRQETVEVVGRDSLRGTADRGEWMVTGRGEVPVRLEDGRHMIVPADTLIAGGDGVYQMQLGPADSKQAEGATIPLAREELQVGKRQVVTGKVVVHKSVHERAEDVEAMLGRDEVDVERVPVNREVEAAEPIRQEGHVTIVPVYEEVLVVEKRLVLREEVRIVRHRQEERHHERVTLRSEDVSVKRERGEGSGVEPTGDAADAELDVDADKPTGRSDA